ncbi:MAG TPA: putative phage tail protein [Fluviicoccus sp.]|nr:putative phage tail protein [Fluviicoccus sp.]
MAVTHNAMREALIALMPRGMVWNTQTDSYWWKLLDVLAAGFNRVNAAADKLLVEANPRTTYELLTDWERALGLPDLCGSSDLSVADRQAAIIARLTAVGGATPAYLIQQAEAMGYAGASIEEYDLSTCEGDCEQSLCDEPWLFTFTLHLPQEPGSLGATCIGSCEDFLGVPPNNRIECLINRIKPAHTHAIYAYGA